MLRTNTSVTTTETTNGSMKTPLSTQISFGDPGREGEGALSKQELFIDKHAEEEVYETLDATSFGPYENGELDEQEQRLNMRNEGRDEDDFSQRMHEIDRRRIIDALCSSLPISKPEKESVKSHFEVLDLDQFGNQKAVQKVGLAAIRHVVDQRRLDHGADWDDLLRNSDEYEDVKETVLDGESGFMNLCHNVKTAIELGDGDGWVSAPSGGPDPNLPNKL